MMKSTLKYALLFALLLIIVGSAANAAVVVNLYAAAAPNVYSSAPYPTWWSNAQSAISTGVASYGSGHAEYVQLSSTGTVSAVLPGYLCAVTGFASWQGVAGVAGEWGQRMHFVYHIYDDTGADVSLANIHDIDVIENGWGDPAYAVYSGYYGAPVSFDATTTWDANKRLGFDSNWNTVTSPNTAAHIVGNFGMAYAGYTTAGKTDQQVLNELIAEIDANLYSWTATLSYGTASADTTVRFAGQDSSVPEPTGVMSLVFGMLGLGTAAGFRRFRK